MTLLIAVLLAVLMFGAIGLFVEAAGWALLVALALLVAGAVTGAVTMRGSGRGNSAAPPLS